MKISKFNSTKFYREFTTRDSCWKGASGIWDIEFLRNSDTVDLLASYYRAKYNTIITIKPMTNLENDTADIAEYLKEARARAEGQEEYREALFIKFFGPPCYENGHAIPIIYIKANKKDALFLVNSLGTQINNHNWIFKRHNLIDIYAIDDMREYSNTGCYIDAFAFLNDAIGKENQVYKIPSLLEHLEKHSASAMDTRYQKITSLHPRLLKTFQSSKLVDQYFDTLNKDISVNKMGHTLADHFERYKKPDKTNTQRPSYVAQKGIRYEAAWHS